MPPKNKDTRKTNESPSAAGGKGKKSSSEDEAGGKGKKSSSEDEDSRTEEITVSISRLSTSKGEAAPPTEEKASKGDEDATEEDEGEKEEDEDVSNEDEGDTGEDEDSRTEEITVSISHLSTSEGEVAPPIGEIANMATPVVQYTSLKETDNLTPPKLKELLTTASKHVAYLVVKCTSGGNSYIHRYKSGDELHTEEKFLSDVDHNLFPEDSVYELFSNYSPCSFRYENICCCDRLQNWHEKCMIEGNQWNEHRIYYVTQHMNLRDHNGEHFQDFRNLNLFRITQLSCEEMEEKVDSFPQEI